MVDAMGLVEYTATRFDSSSFSPYCIMTVLLQTRILAKIHLAVI